MTYLRLSWLTLKNRLLEEARYPFQFVINYVSFFILGYVLALGGMAIQGSGTIEANMAGFFLAFMAGGALNLPIDILAGNKTRLEEFYLRPLPSLPYLLALAIGRSLETVTTLALFIVIVGFIRGAGFEVSIRLVLIGFPVFFSMLGLGLALAGVRLVYQKIGSLPQIVWLVLFGTALAASSTALYQASVWSSFAGGLLYVREGILQPTWFVVSSAASILIGVMVFRWGEQAMLRRGLISQE